VGGDSFSPDSGGYSPGGIASLIVHFGVGRAHTQFGGGRGRPDSLYSTGLLLACGGLSLLFDYGEFTGIDPYVEHFSHDFGLD
jgi:hypothetical protein